jgi:hypothetical protein
LFKANPSTSTGTIWPTRVVSSHFGCHVPVLDVICASFRAAKLAGERDVLDTSGFLPAKFFD